MKKKMAYDMALNIIATAIPIAVLQIFILPAVSANMQSSQYGLVVTIISVYNIVSVATGNTLSNIRLVKGNTSERIPNYNVMLLILSFANFLIVSGFCIYYENEIVITNILLNVLASSLWLIKEYLIVDFRININSVNMLKSNAALSVGYIIGFLLFKVTNLWQLIYISGLLICVSFICSKSQLWRDPIKIDKDFRLIADQTLLLLMATIMYKIPTYADKMIVYPILGGSETSVLYVATLFGRIVSMAIIPVSSVILSYISKSHKKNNKSFLTAFGIGCIVGVIGYAVCLIASKPILGYLYPREIEEVIGLMPITTATIVVNALITIVNSFVLYFFDMKWQAVINGIYVLIYIVISIPLLFKYGLLGFCIGTLIAAFFKLLFEMTVFLKGNTVNAP